MKAWETVAEPRLLVVGHYRMGFEVQPASGGSRVRVFIDYALPEAGLPRLLGILFANWYADWCTRMMADDVKRALAETAAELVMVSSTGSGACDRSAA